MKSAFYILIVTAIISAIPVFAATTFYINATSGNNAWDGRAPIWDGTHGPKRTIQAGIDIAAAGDIVEAADGTYTGTGNFNIDFKGKAITVKSQNGNLTCIIDCTDSGRAFYFHTAEGNSSKIDGFTIKNGDTTEDGGGIYCTNSSPTITNCIIRYCHSDYDGGGIACDTNSRPVISYCTITKNVGYWNGGGISLQSGSNAVISNCTVNDNRAYNENGGGIFCLNSSPSISYCTFIFNESDNSGGGILCKDYSSPIISYCNFQRNESGSSGAGISCSNYSSPTIENCSFSNNTSYYSGGGILCSSNSSPIISKSTFMNNQSTSDHGGAISISSVSSPTINKCIIINNRAYERGGGIWIWNSSSPVISGCNILENSAEEGGGIACELNCNPLIMNCAIGRNDASSNGGGVWLSNNCSPVIKNSTIAYNTSPAGGGVYCDNSSPSITNSILWRDSNDEIAAPSGTPIVNYCDIQGGYIGTGNFSEDPLFINILRNDYHLHTCSPCIDAGLSTNMPLTDVDDESRWNHPSVLNTGGGAITYYDIGFDEVVDMDNDTLPDIWEIENSISASDNGSINPINGPQGDPDTDGLTNFDELIKGTYPYLQDTDGDTINDNEEALFETNPLHPDNAEKIYYVNAASGDDSYDGLRKTWDSIHGPKKTIQAGVDAALSNWGYTIQVSDGTYTGLGNNNIIFEGKNINVRSENGPLTTTIDGENGGYIFCLTLYEPEEVIIDGFTICHGGITKAAAIYLLRSNPKIRNCIFDDNGGAIWLYGSKSTIENCTFNRNSKSTGAAIDSTASQLTINGCIFIENTTSTYGGTIYSNSIEELSISNCVINGSYAGNQGGAIYLDKGNLYLKNCLINNSISNWDGGAIYLGSADGIFDNCTIVDCFSIQGQGGAIYCYGAGAVLENSILWNNSPDNILPYSYDPPIVSFCDVQGGWEGMGNIDLDPVFVQGPKHSYYLSQTNAGQSENSPCVDAGNGFASNLFLSRFSTSTDHLPDEGVVDIGYHEYCSPQIYSIVHGMGGIEIRWNVLLGESYVVEWSEDMFTWNTVIVGQASQWTDSDVEVFPRKYYRVRGE